MKLLQPPLTVTALATCFALACSAPPAFADCANGVSAILQSASSATSIIPVIGPVASAGLALSDLFACGDGSSFDLQILVDLVRTELDSNAITQTERNLELIANKIDRLSIDLQGPLYAGAQLESLTPDLARDLIARVEEIEGMISLAESEFFAALTTPNNQRREYDLTLPMVLANYRLGLLNFIRAAAPNDSSRAEDWSNIILNDFDAYKQEAERLSDFTYTVNVVNLPSSGITARIKIDRAGKEFANKQLSCTTMPIGPSDACSFDTQRAAGQEWAYQRITKQLTQFDLQNETHSWILNAKAGALQADPSADLSDFSSFKDPETPVLLLNAHPNARNRCLFLRGGGINVSNGVLSNGSTRMRTCDPLVNRERVLLKENGQIRSTIANLCLEPVSRENKVFFRTCDDNLPQQQWVRDGNRFKINFNGNTRCLTPRPDHISATDETLRHVPCTHTAAQFWYAFSPLINKDLPGDVEPITPDSDLFGVEADPTLCLGFGEFNDRVGFREPALTQCDRYRPEGLWAQGADGELRPFLAPKQILGGRFQGAPLVLKPESNNSAGSQYIRSKADDGSVTFLLKKGSGRYLFPDFVDKGSLVFANLAPTNGLGKFEERAFWDHFNGGNWKE